jgi:hypothetical protein
MNKNDVDSYRNQLDEDISKTFKEIDTNISYIIVGALGFFITMLDKFIDVNHALLIICMFASFAFLLISFILFLTGKHLHTHHSLKILTFVDNDFVSKAEDEAKETELNEMWEEANKKINRNRNWIYFFLGIGVVLQVVFFSVNIFFRSKQDSSKLIKVEIVGQKATNTNPSSTTVIKAK